MRELTYYQQLRRDGGLRTGIDLDQETSLLSDFLDGSPELQDDPMGPALVWFVDLRCRGDELPIESEAAREWFLEHVETFREGFARLADALVGVDASETIRWADFPRPIPGVQAEIVCSATRRSDGRAFAETLREVARELPDSLRVIREPEPLHL